MNRRYIIFLVLVGVMLVSAQSCAKGGGTATAGPFVGGTDGLTFRFLDDAPPAEDNFAGEPVGIEVEVTNLGENTVGANSAEVRLVGSVLSGLFSLYSDLAATTPVADKQAYVARNTAILEGIQKESDFTDTETVTVGSVKVSQLGTPSYTVDVTAQLCYPYQTRLQVDDLCIPSEKERAQVGTPKCDIVREENIVDTGDNSGAPVQVTSVTERKQVVNGVAGLALNIEISNKGGGQVVKDSIACATSIETNNKDKVLVELDNNYQCTFGETKSEGVPQGKVQGYVVLRDGVGRLRCTRPAPNQGPAYTERFTVVLGYKYIQEMSKSVKIENL
jgi:hypothetical protein